MEAIVKNAVDDVITSNVKPFQKAIRGWGVL